MLISIGIKFKKVDKACIFGSSIENGVLNLWNSEKIDKKKALNAPPGLFFRYADQEEKFPLIFIGSLMRQGWLSEFLMLQVAR